MTRENTTSYQHPQETNLMNLHKAMEYNERGEPIIRTADAQAGYTSKNRSKVSTYETLFFNTFQYGLETDIWDQTTANSASAVHNSNTNNVDMSVTDTLGSKIIRQTKSVMTYIPGRTSTLTYAIRFQTPVTGIRRRIGLFDDDNGFYFEDAGVIVDGLPEYNVVVRSSTSGSPVEIRIPRSQWNGDKLDGTGTSGIIADATKQQIVNFEYEWYGAGQVVIGWTINGFTHTVHTFNHANIESLPWASTPFLPIRLELENLTGSTSGGPHYLYQGSNSLISEGQATKLGTANSISSPVWGTNIESAISSANPDRWYPLLSIRLKADQLKGIVLPRFFQVATLDNTNIFYKLVRNATIPSAVTLGADGPQPWLDQPDPNSFTQYQTYIDPALIAPASHGTVLDQGFVNAGGGGTSIQINPETSYQIGRSTTTTIGDTSDVFTLLVASPIGNKDAVAAITWVEQR